ncbi:trypsin-like peptidase domain-containing protein [bacterium]|nr:trypsin-like peptidase domain-containing protein [bacterium]
MTKTKHGFIGVVALFVLSQSAFALPLPRKDGSNVRIPISFGQAYDFEGIVALSNCSGSLFRFETSVDTDKAMILTNGHCVHTDMIEPGKFVSNEPSTRKFDLLERSGNEIGTVRATKLVYATMTKTDIGIYELSETYAEILKKHNIRPLTLSSQKTTVAQDIEVVSGYWTRGYTCSVEAFVPKLLEDDYVWEDSLRYSRPGCETIGGTSGSPIVAKGTKTIIGVNNTGNEDGEKCTMNNPCEVDTAGAVSFEQGLSYGQQTYWIYSCVNSKREIDLTVSGCQLPH